MQIINPLKMNDWEIKKFLKVVMSIQLAMWGTIGLDAIGLHIPILRQLISFIYLLFIPGIIILRILKLHKLSNIETLLYAVGLSLAFLMFTGLFMNTVYPLLGISGPISTIPLLITISLVVFGLCYISYKIDKDFSAPSFYKIKEISQLPALFLCLIPFLSVFGTYLMNYHKDNILIMFLIIAITVIVFLICFDKFIPNNLYPLAVFVIALSLLFHTSLITNYIWGWDIHQEYYLSNLVMVNSLWDPTFGSNINAMLSITMLVPIISNIGDISITWIFKLIYPFIFSFVPVGLFFVFQKQTDDKIAFLSSFYFMSYSIFYSGMFFLARQEIAELFFVLMILTMINKTMDIIKRSFLTIVFAVSMAVSHYGLSYLYMFSLIAAWLILKLVENPWIQKIWNTLYKKYTIKGETLPINTHFSIGKYRTISSTFVVFFIIFTLSWYMYVSSSSALNSISNIVNHIFSSIDTEILNPEVVEGLKVINTQTYTPLHDINKFINYINQIFIIIGIFALLLKQRQIYFEKLFVVFVLIYLALNVAGVTVPYFAAIGMSRLYQITLFFLSPFVIIGGLTAIRIFSRIFRVSWTDRRINSSLKVMSIYLVIFFLFSIGFVYEITKENSMSIALNNTFDYPLFNEQEMLTGEWLADKKMDSIQIYSDDFRGFVMGQLLGTYNIFWGDKEITSRIPDNVYIFLGRENVKNGNIRIQTLNGGVNLVKLQNSKFYNNILLNMSKTYNNGDAEVYYR